ncbi:hypothetical protein [Streptomyces spirodelae]|uniref:Uncharacterized protein n=1 Tax=Streptomyces spirodelae TaxID=2812904 RepID=A0ABS3WM37_9ACTN|nr:hypothetical protein [Streptomyces spirodelae]MBO8184188.1 hypothetical protein [Streptomyces spirodelae]
MTMAGTATRVCVGVVAPQTGRLAPLGEPLSFAVRTLARRRPAAQLPVDLPHFAWGLDDIATVFADVWKQLGLRLTLVSNTRAPAVPLTGDLVAAR